MKPFVSIITPCYNGEDFLDSYFESILSQTYANIELIFVDDGSTDSTAAIANNYRKEFMEHGMDFIYIHQKNQGQAAALNQGLAIFRGDYFIWPDSDDLLEPDSIEKRVGFLESHPEFGFVRSNADFFDYDTKKKLYRASNLDNRFHADIFLDLILENTYCYCGCYMVRRKVFLEIYPQRKIEISSVGQNWQLLIPISGRYQCGYIDEDLYHIAVRKDSHSRQQRNYKQEMERRLKLKEILLSSIKVSGRSDLDYLEIVEIKYLRIYFATSLMYHQYENGKKYYEQLRKKKAVTVDDRKRYLHTFYPILYKCYDILLRVYAKMKRMVEEYNHE